MEATVECIPADLNTYEGVFVHRNSIVEDEVLEAVSSNVDFVVIPHDVNKDVLKYRFHIGELLTAIACSACNAVDVNEHPSENEWLNIPNALPLMIPYATLPLTAKHMQVLVLSVFRKVHFRRKVDWNCTRFFFAADVNMPYLVTRLLQYVFCKGGHYFVPIAEALAPSAVKSMFEWEEKPSRVVRFTRAHRIALQCSIQKLFGDDVALDVDLDVLKSRMWPKLIKNDLRQDAIATALLNYFHDLVNADNRTRENIYVSLPCDFRERELFRGPTVAVDERDLCRLHLHIRRLMMDPCNVREVKSSFLLHLLFVVNPFSHREERAIMRLLKKDFSEESISQVVVFHGEGGNDQGAIMDCTIDCTKIWKDSPHGVNSPSDVIQYVIRCSSVMLRRCKANHRPIVATLSPYARSIVYPNGLCFYVSSSICQPYNRYPSPQCIDHYKANIV